MLNDCYSLFSCFMIFFCYVFALVSDKFFRGERREKILQLLEAMYGHKSLFLIYLNRLQSIWQREAGSSLVRIMIPFQTELLKITNRPGIPTMSCLNSLEKFNHYMFLKTLCYILLLVLTIAFSRTIDQIPL